MILRQGEGADQVAMALHNPQALAGLQRPEPQGAIGPHREQPASMSHASYDAADRRTYGIDDALVRLSVGLEDFDDLRADLQQALESHSTAPQEKKLPPQVAKGRE